MKNPTPAQLSQWIAELSNPDPLFADGETIGEIAERINRHRDAVSKIVQKLIASGHMERGKAWRPDVRGFSRTIVVFRVKAKKGRGHVKGQAVT